MKISHPYVQKFQEFWSAPNTADIFRLLAHDDVVLIQPLSPPLRGAAAVRREFDALFKVFPDISGEVLSFAEDPETKILFINWLMRFKLAGLDQELSVVDTIVLRDGKAVKRIAHMDLLPVLFTIFTRPWLWPRWIRFLAKM